MSIYYIDTDGVWYSETDYLVHSYGGHAKEKKNHKYIAKIETPDGVRYFYSQHELDAYYNKLRKEVNAVSEKYNNFEKAPTFKTTKKSGKKTIAVYKSINGLSDSEKKKHAKEIEAAYAAQANRKAFLDKYQTQLNGH